MSAPAPVPHPLRSPTRLILASSIAVLFGACEETDVAHFVALPEIAWEASLGIYLIVKGFRPSPLLV